MRNLIFAINVTLDGCCDHTKGIGSDDVLVYHTRLLRDVDLPGKAILVGGVAVPTQLMELGLIDEYRVLVQPIVVGEGRRLFDGVSLQERLQLKLVESSRLNSGVVALHYVRQ